MNFKQLLEQLDQKKKVNSSDLITLADQGLIRVSDVTNHDTASGQREYLFIGFTEKGRTLLQS